MDNSRVGPIIAILIMTYRTAQTFVTLISNIHSSADPIKVHMSRYESQRAALEATIGSKRMAENRFVRTFQINILYLFRFNESFDK